MICQGPQVWGRLNAFQQLMLHWSELHPYNATHTYKIAGPLCAARLRTAIRKTYLANGLGIAHLAADGQSYRHATDLAPEIEILEDLEQPAECLTRHLTRELNRPFARPACRPLRFSAVDAGPRFHYVTLCYDHWLADSTAARDARTQRS